MAQIIPPATTARLNALAGPLVNAAYEECASAVLVHPGATDDEIAQARAVHAVVYAFSAVLQSMPLNQGGAMAAVASMAGTVLGQCDGDRRVLYALFQKQFSATLAEIAAARMPAQGNA